MTKKTSPAVGANSALDTVQGLIEVADIDTVYRDVYLRRARGLLVGVLSLDEYRGMKGVQRAVDEAVRESKAAAMMQDWKRVAERAEHAEQLRRGAEAKAAVMTVGALVYDAPTVVIDPFSPGLEKPGQALGEIRDLAVRNLVRLANSDASLAGFYEGRRAFLAGLALAAPKHATDAAAKASPAVATADIERLAFDAAQRGDVAELRRHAQDILTRKAKEAAAPKAAKEKDEPASPLMQGAYECPVDLATPFADEVARRARELGFAVARTEPLPQAAPLFEFVQSRMWQAQVSDAESEHEGALKIETLVDQGSWPADVSEHVKVLVGQFVRNPFVNSGGARYRPAFAAEAVLIEDFPEDQESPAGSELLAALGLGTRRGLSRTQVESALLEHGAEILKDRLGLDAMEFRLVCVPQDLYSRFGRDHGWGQQRQWTHFDGYQIMTGGRLRALVGGDAKYGGLNDLASIASTDQRDSVIARFAVIRRARHVGRWR